MSLVAVIAAAASLWVPSPGDTVQVQLAGKVDTSVEADVFYVDGAETPKATVEELHARGAHVACYLSAGSWERYRDDADDFPQRVIGRKLAHWRGERWLDVRRVRALMPIMKRRLDMCAAKGFDAADFDNVEGYANPSGFPLTGKHQLRYNRLLARAAHARGMSVSLKNDLGQIPRLVDDFDFALNEQCLAYEECGHYRPFVRAGKAVFHIEYQGEWPKAKSCEVPGFSSIRARLSLRGYRASCSA